MSGALVAAVASATSASGHPWLPKDLNTGHLDYFLALCGGLMAANTLLFVAVANRYEYKVRAVLGGSGAGGAGRAAPARRRSLLCMGACSLAVCALVAALHVPCAHPQTAEHVVLVLVPDEEQQAEGRLPPAAGLPPRAPSPLGPRQGGAAAIAINASAVRRSQYHYAAQPEGGEEGGALYSRSLAFVPTSPALPAPFR
jgi:hypothetical protein